MLKNLKFKIFFQTQILKIYLLLILNIFNILRIRFQVIKNREIVFSFIS